MKHVLVLAILLFPALVMAEPPPVFDTSEQEARYRTLIEEFRCPKCQNQALSDSDAPLAQDLRQQIARQVQQGRSDAEIRNYLVSRYSDFVLYRPPVQPNTWLLWAAPFGLLAGGALAALVAVRRRAGQLNDTDASEP